MLAIISIKLNESRLHSGPVNKTKTTLAVSEKYNSRTWQGNFNSDPQILLLQIWSSLIAQIRVILPSKASTILSFLKNTPTLYF